MEIVIFLCLFIPAISACYHGIYHYVNQTFHRWCFYCWVGRWLGIFDAEEDKNKEKEDE